MKSILVAALMFLVAGGIASGEDFPTISDHVTSQSQLEDLDSGLGIADGSKARPIIALGLDLIKDFEAWIPGAYNDPSMFCTIGYGHLIAKKACGSISLGQFAKPLTVAEGAALLEQDTVSARLAVMDLVNTDLTDEQFAALSSFTFNVGKGNFKSSTLLKLVNAELYDDAAKQFARWVRSAGKELPGLVSRRNCEAALFRGELAYDASGKFKRSSCASLGIAGDVGPLIDIETGE